MYETKLHPNGAGTARPTEKVPFYELLAPAGEPADAVARGLGALGRVASRAVAAYRRRRAINATVAELARLDARTLQDIGIPRSMIRVVAEQVVDGKRPARRFAR